MKSYKITLPFPPMILSPNSRKHWAVKMPHKQAYRQAGQIAARGVKHRITQRTPMSVTFYCPANRYDLDNLLATIKSGIDGIADGLGINDKLLRPITIDDQIDKKNPRVEIEIRPSPYTPQSKASHSH